MRTLDTFEAASSTELEMLRSCCAAVHSVSAEAEVILFGSRARGDGGGDSDWDILVLCPTVTPDIYHRMHQALYDVELDADVVINPLILHRQEWRAGRYREHPLRERVMQEGAVL